MERAELIASMTPQLHADVTLYPTSDNGKSVPALPGWGCPCMVAKMQLLVGYDGFPQLGDQPLRPGDQRRLGFVFLSPEGAETMRRAGRFYLWEGKFIGEAQVVTD